MLRFRLTESHVIVATEVCSKAARCVEDITMLGCEHTLCTFWFTSATLARNDRGERIQVESVLLYNSFSTERYDCLSVHDGPKTQCDVAKVDTCVSLPRVCCSISSINRIFSSSSLRSMQSWCVKN